MTRIGSIDLPPRRFLCWLIDLTNPGNSEEVGVSSVVMARDADQAASWYADEYDWSYGTELHAKPLRIGTVEQLANGETGTPRLVEVHLQTDPHHAWYAVVGDQLERDAFAVSWQLIQCGLWGQMGETRASKLQRGGFRTNYARFRRAFEVAAQGVAVAYRLTKQEEETHGTEEGRGREPQELPQQGGRR